MYVDESSFLRTGVVVDGQFVRIKCICRGYGKRSGREDCAALGGNDLSLALSEAQDAVHQYPNSAQLYQMLGSAQFRNGSKEDARAAFQRATIFGLNTHQLLQSGAVELSLDHYARSCDFFKYIPAV